MPRPPAPLLAASLAALFAFGAATTFAQQVETLDRTRHGASIDASIDPPVAVRPELARDVVVHPAAPALPARIAESFLRTVAAACARQPVLAREHRDDDVHRKRPRSCVPRMRVDGPSDH